MKANHTPQHADAKNSATAPFLAIGGSGKTGRRVVGRLKALGHDVRSASRSSSPSFDWHDDSNWSEVLDGRNASLGDGVQRALGRPPRDFRSFLQKAQLSGAFA